MKNERKVYIAGIGITKFGYYPDKESYEIGAEAVLNSLTDSEVELKDIQAAYCGSVYQGTGSGHQVINEISPIGIPIFNVENACSSSASAFHLAFKAVASGEYDAVLAFGYEQMPRGPIASTAFRPWQLEQGFNVQPANYALETIEYMNNYGVTEEDFARVSVKNRKNGSKNPNARFQKKVTLEEVLNSRLIASPLRLFNACPLADGASAFVITSEEKVKNKQKSVEIVSSTLASAVYGQGTYQSGTVNSVKYYPEVGITEKTAQEAYEDSGYGPEDIHVVQAYDSMSPSELWDIEQLGFCKPGEAASLLKEGYFDIDGKLPVNTDGGLLSRGHPLGATGAAQIYEIALQLRGEAGARQVSNARVGLSHALGAGPNSAVTILKK